MKAVINLLIQLDELTSARAQKEAANGNAPLAELDAAIGELSSKLPPTLAQQFQRLQKRLPSAIVPVRNGACGGCSLALPVSMAHAVKAAKQVYACPNCARLLYYPAIAPLQRSTKSAKSRLAPVEVGIARFSSPKLMLPLCAARSRDEVLQVCCDLLGAEQYVDDPAELFERAVQREEIISTAVDHGVAFPHVRGVEGGGLALALVSSAKGVRFDPNARQLSRLIFFVVIPSAASAFYLKLLAGLSSTLQAKENRDLLLEQETPEGLWKALVKMTRKTVH